MSDLTRMIKGLLDLQVPLSSMVDEALSKTDNNATIQQDVDEASQQTIITLNNVIPDEYFNQITSYVLRTPTFRSTIAVTLFLENLENVPTRLRMSKAAQTIMTLEQACAVLYKLIPVRVDDIAFHQPDFNKQDALLRRAEKYIWQFGAPMVAQVSATGEQDDVNTGYYLEGRAVTMEEYYEKRRDPTAEELQNTLVDQFEPIAGDIEAGRARISGL